MVSAPLEVNVTEPPAPVVEITPDVIAPVLLMLTLPPPLWEMLTIVSGAAELTKTIFPAVALVALNEPTRFALPSVVPVLPVELVVNDPALMIPAPASLMTPAAACCAEDSTTLEDVVTPPAFSKISRPAVAVIAPEVLLAVAFN